MSGFNWNSDADVVLRAYGSIAVHENDLGDVVIRQERDALEDEDHFVVVPVQDAELIAKAIVNKANEIKEGWSSERPPSAKQPPKQDAEPRLALPAPAHTTARPTHVTRGVA